MEEVVSEKVELDGFFLAIGDVGFELGEGFFGSGVLEVIKEVGVGKGVVVDCGVG